MVLLKLIRPSVLCPLVVNYLKNYVMQKKYGVYKLGTPHFKYFWFILNILYSDT